MKFGKFFGNESVPQKSEYELEKEREADKARNELNELEVDRDEIVNEMFPEEVVTLNKKLFGLLNKLPRDEVGRELLTLSEEEQDRIPDDMDEKGILDYMGVQSPRAREYLIRTIDDQASSLDIGEKFRTYYKEHWQEVFRNRINSGITPFGDETNFIKDVFLKQGIDLENPTEGDINAYFQGQEYGSSAIGWELDRRRKEEFADIGALMRETMDILLHRLLIKDSMAQGKEKYYRGEEEKERLLEIKEKLK